jgi:hypothetical protein
VKNGVKRANHFRPQRARSSALRVSAKAWRRLGALHP